MKVYRNIKCGNKRKVAFYLQTGNVEGQGQRQGSPWIVLIKVYMHVSLKEL